MLIAREFSFEAAHFLPAVGPSHKCATLHGHSYRVTLTLSGPVDPRFGWVMDFGELLELVEPLRNMLDHHTLNDIVGLENPTAEHLALWFWGHLDPQVPLVEVKVMETAHSGAIYRGEDAS